MLGKFLGPEFDGLVTRFDNIETTVASIAADLKKLLPPEKVEQHKAIAGIIFHYFPAAIAECDAAADDILLYLETGYQRFG